MKHQDLLLSKASSLLLIVDFQERLARAMSQKDQVEDRIIRLVEIAHQLHVPCFVTEQYSKGLGSTTPDLARVLTNCECYQPIEKLHFSCFGSPEFNTVMKNYSSRSNLIVTGIETHVCVLQTVHDALMNNYAVYTVADASTSRSVIDYKYGLKRMRDMGAHIVTFEMVVFEWLRQAGTPEFKTIHKFIV
ncbi:isochorismatase family protein [candidate division CSSED10-310 bacterium]|uniref:Isochorismatase family protein n=1 Tax=candidate division CSSED10-310 bacterium TaxID=2855610 RepID=A0ABV6YTD5_UNCC1